MIKIILQICILAFVTLLTYDTINLYLNNSKLKGKTNLEVVKREIEIDDKWQIDEKIIDTYDNFPIALYYGAPGTLITSIVVGYFLFKHLRKSKSDELKADESADKTDSSTLSFEKSEELVVKEEPKYSAKETVDNAKSVQKVLSRADGDFDSSDFRIQGIKIDEALAQLLTGRQYNCFNAPEQDFVVMPSLTIDDEYNIKCPSSTDDLNPMENSSINFFGNVSSNAVMCHTSSDRSTSPPPFYIDPKDIEDIDRRLTVVEYELKTSTGSTKELGQRIELAETELVDLHEQMYSLITKPEKEEMPNYIILSQNVPKEESIFLGDRGENILLPEKEENLFLEYKEETVSNMQDVFEKKKPNLENEVQIRYTERTDIDLSLTNESQIGDHVYNSEYSVQSIKVKSVGLEAILENTLPKNPINYKKARPRVPPHIIPPYKRSSFTNTNSKAYLVTPPKNKRRL